MGSTFQSIVIKVIKQKGCLLRLNFFRKKLFYLLFFWNLNLESWCWGIWFSQCYRSRSCQAHIAIVLRTVLMVLLLLFLSRVCSFIPACCTLHFFSLLLLMRCFKFSLTITLLKNLFARILYKLLLHSQRDDKLLRLTNRNVVFLISSNDEAPI